MRSPKSRRWDCAAVFIMMPGTLSPQGARADQPDKHLTLTAAAYTIGALAFTVDATVAPAVEPSEPRRTAPKELADRIVQVVPEREEFSPATDSAKCATVEKEGRAIAACTRLLQGHDLTRSERATYRSNRGAAYLNLGDYDLALEDLNESRRAISLKAHGSTEAACI